MPLIGANEHRPRTLLRTMVFYAFFKIREAHLLDLCKHLERAVSVEKSLLDILEALFKHAFPSCTGGDVSQALARRAQRLSRYAETTQIWWTNQI